MKKLTQIVAAIVLSVAFVGIGNVANAAEGDCDVLIINGTGPDSNNEADCTSDIKVNVECVNDIYVLTKDSQDALTGDAVVGGNVTADTAISGNATNKNGVTVQIGAEGCAAEEEEEQGAGAGAGAAAGAAAPSVPAAGVGAAAPKKVAALPFTAGNSTLETAAISAIVLATVFATIRLAVTAYRRQALKQ